MAAAQTVLGATYDPATSTSPFMHIIQKDYSTNEQYFIIFLRLVALSSFYPVIYTLASVHRKRGFDIVFCGLTIITTFIYKVMLTLDMADQFLSQDSWHKLSNIFLLTQFCSLIIYLARIPKEYQGYLIGIGMSLIIILQEKDSFTFKYALIPLIFNNLLLIISSFCQKEKPPYVNSRMVVFGAIWYVISIVSFLGAYHKLLDFFYIFDDIFIFSNGMSLFYSWQTYEKNDLTFGKFLTEQFDILNTIRNWQQQIEKSQQDDNIMHLQKKSLMKKAAKKEQKLLALAAKNQEDEEKGSLLRKAKKQDQQEGATDQ